MKTNKAKAILPALSAVCLLSQCSTPTGSINAVPRVPANPEQAGLGGQSPSLYCLNLGTLKTPAPGAPLQLDQGEWLMQLREARELGYAPGQAVPPPAATPPPLRPWEAALANCGPLLADEGTFLPDAAGR